jgi:hypothetical protein
MRKCCSDGVSPVKENQDRVTNDTKRCGFRLVATVALLFWLIATIHIDISAARFLRGVGSSYTTTVIRDDMNSVYQESDESHSPNLHENVDPILRPIVQSGGMMYSMCRLDRSGSFILEMLHAHAFAFHNNLTYAGNCCVSSGIPREDTFNLLKNLQWDKILPFACPDGVDSMKYNFHWPLPNATEISPLMLNGNVFRKNCNFQPAWRESIRKELLQQIQISIANDTDVAMTTNDTPYEIAVHVRRGDATPCTNRTHVQRRYLPNSYYICHWLSNIHRLHKN